MKLEASLANVALVAVLALHSANAAAVAPEYSNEAPEYETAKPPSWTVPLTSSKGQSLLFASSSDVVRLNSLAILSNLQTQQTQTYCGVASAVTALNSLDAREAPLEPAFWPYAQFTQDTFFSSECALDIATPKLVGARGLTLQQLTGMVRCYLPPKGKATAAHGKDKYPGVDEMREALVRALRQKDVRVLANYLRREFDGGHWSPLAAYNADADMFLIADVERFIYPPLWISAEDLYDAVTTIDADSGKSRGFIFIQV